MLYFFVRLCTSAKAACIPCKRDYAKTTNAIFMKLGGRVQNEPRKNIARYGIWAVWKTNGVDRYVQQMKKDSRCRNIERKKYIQTCKVTVAADSYIIQQSTIVLSRGLHSQTVLVEFFFVAIIHHGEKKNLRDWIVNISQTSSACQTCSLCCTETCIAYSNAL